MPSSEVERREAYCGVMANIVKRIDKHGGESLRPGEVVTGALCVTPKGTLGRTAGGALGGAVGGAAAAAASTSRSDGIGPGRSAGFDQSIRWLAITDARFLAFSGQMKPKTLVFECSLDELDHIEVTARIQRLLTIVFDDGSSAKTEAFRTGNDFRGFQKAAVAAGKLAPDS